MAPLFNQRQKKMAFASFRQFRLNIPPNFLFLNRFRFRLCAGALPLVPRFAHNTVEPSGNLC